MNRINFTIIILLLLFFNRVYSHNNSEIIFIEQFLTPLKKHQIDIVENRKSNLKSPFLLKFVECQLESIKYKKISDSTFVFFESLQRKGAFTKTLYHINKGDYIFNKYRYHDSVAVEQYEIAYDIAKKNNYRQLASESLRRICNYFFRTQGSTFLLKESLSRYQNYLYDNFEEYKFTFYTVGLKMQENYLNQQKTTPISFDDLFLKVKKIKNPMMLGESYLLKGSYDLLFLKKYDSALNYYNLSIKEYNKCKTNYCKTKLLGLEINKAICYQYQGEYDKSLRKLDSLKKVKIPNQNLREQLSIYQYLKTGYQNLEKYDIAFQMQSIERKIKDSLELLKHNTALSESRIKHQTIEKEKENIQLKKDKRNLMFGSIILLIFGSIIALLIYKNTKRKQRIAEQERQIEIQKTEKLLKDQELTAIDAMISGQEKERQRLANELHDNLGSTLATVKLHFQHLTNNRANSKIENIEELYTKTDHLLEEAYQKVRTIAHEKNSGVMANQGLLPAIKKFARKASNGDVLQIEVQDYGLEERLDNALEISIFRMIQELITNIIKHANATEVHISLTNHDALLNIIIEDNGKGFDSKALLEKDGMGLKTIEKRIEHLEGTFEIDSTIGKGTNIIINIPI